MEKPNDEIWMLCTNSAMRRATRQLGQLYDGVLGNSGLKGTQFTLLSQIRHDGAPALKALAEALVMDLSALGHTLKPLMRDGLVELVADEKDKRIKHARLTALGEKTQADMVERWQEAQARFDGAFGKEKSKEIRRALAVIASPGFAKAFSGEPGDS